MEFATVTLLEKTDSSMVNGIITDKNGQFMVGAQQAGDYILKVKFIGYDPSYQNINLDQAGTRDVGQIVLQSSSINIGEVSVRANKRSIEYQIDRKVINVEGQYTASSGNAIDILKNVPSIQVDIENNVSLRGNSNFTVLIDGRPSVLEGSEALQQMPAGMIKDIEIITNPSAKFDPEGTAGIINIITKKRTLTGFSGISHLDAGLDEKYGGDFLLNYRTEKFNFFIGGDYNNRNYPGNITRRQETYNGDTINYLNSEGTYKRGYEHYSGRGGIEWFPDDKNTLSLSGRYGGRSMLGLSDLTYQEWTNFSPDKNNYTNGEEWRRWGNFFGGNLEYTHDFTGSKGKADHRFDLHLAYHQREGNEESVNFLLDDQGQKADGQRSTEVGPGTGLHYRVNYKQPFSKAFNLEAGAQGRMHRSSETNEVFYYDPANDKFLLQEKFSHEVDYQRDINALYGLLKGEYSNVGYQLGLRTEHTDRDVEVKGQDPFYIKRWDFFPTAHASYHLGEKDQFMASYSRRIRRPRGWYLEPFITWTDAYNVRRGNPGLQPEYIDSYELGYQRDFNDKHSLSTELYYRVSENEIERVRSMWKDNIMLTTYANVGHEYRLGSEIMFNTAFFSWWEADLIGNFYDYRVKGEINGRAFDRGSFTWSARVNNIFRLGENTRVQLTPEYDSREVEAQDVEAPEFELDGAIRQSFMNNKLNLTLQVRDILATGKYEGEITEEDFYAYRLYRHKAPIVMLNITWRINNYRNGKNNRQGDGGDEGFGDDGGM
jgi:outer membrane receptor protein involved in Fe transport